MTPEQITLVKESFAKVKPIAPQAASLFYGRLFEIAPEVRPLFKGDIEEQGRKLMQVIATAVGALDRLGDIVPVVQDLGRRHAGYGVSEAAYDKVAEALLWTLGQGLGAAFTPAVKEAWTATYTILADTMKAAAKA
jgi:hemoglobin-like flavoprotein